MREIGGWGAFDYMSSTMAKPGRAGRVRAAPCKIAVCGAFGLAMMTCPRGMSWPTCMQHYNKQARQLGTTAPPGTAVAWLIRWKRGAATARCCSRTPNLHINTSNPRHVEGIVQLPTRISTSTHSTLGAAAFICGLDPATQACQPPAGHSFGYCKQMRFRDQSAHDQASTEQSPAQLDAGCSFICSVNALAGRVEHSGAHRCAAPARWLLRKT